MVDRGKPIIYLGAVTTARGASLVSNVGAMQAKETVMDPRACSWDGPSLREIDKAKKELMLEVRKLDIKQSFQSPRPSQNVKHTLLNKLTGGYRKRLSGFGAVKQNVEFFQDFQFATFTALTPRTYKNVHARGKPFNHGFRAKGL